jgi:hypothetical protein
MWFMIILEYKSCETRKHMLSILIDPKNLKGFVSHYGFLLMHMMHNKKWAKSMTQQTIDYGHKMESLSYPNQSDVGSSYVCHDNSKA